MKVTPKILELDPFPYMLLMDIIMITIRHDNDGFARANIKQQFSFRLMANQQLTSGIWRDFE